MNNAPFYIGQKVVCISDHSPEVKAIAQMLVGIHVIPTVGSIYTVRGIDTSPGSAGGIYLMEIICPNDPFGGGEISFAYNHFAPLSEIDEKEFIREYKKQLV